MSWTKPQCSYCTALPLPISIANWNVDMGIQDGHQPVVVGTVRFLAEQLICGLVPCPLPAGTDSAAVSCPASSRCCCWMGDQWRWWCVSCSAGKRITPNCQTSSSCPSLQGIGTIKATGDYVPCLMLQLQSTLQGRRVIEAGFEHF